MKRKQHNSRVRALTTVAGGAVSTRRMFRLDTQWVGATLGALLMLASARAGGPVNPKVTYGNATFQKVGNNWVITTSGKAIIRYSSFDVAWGQWIKFVQPGADSRVLNRIDGAAPTRIDGTIMANGQVYFVNPAGVIFGNGAVINCGSFAAAAGQLSDQDFLNGRDRFTNLSGNVVNNGHIEVPQGGAVKLIGQHVANYGKIVAPQGTVVLAAGNEVLVGESGGRIYARISGDGVGRAEGVRNEGTIEAAKGRVLMGAGDIYGMAVINTGRVVARSIKIDGGKHGEVRVAGELDASGKAVGEKGGRVEITGEKIALTGANVDVSGDNGGGVALIGGGREGQGLANAADALYVDSASTVNADAIRTGNGGTIVLYSHNSTRSGGKLTARGGTRSGNGGFIETSGGWLQLSGAPDTSARALLGKGGEWLIDPLNLDIVAGSSSDISGPPVFTPTGTTGFLSVADLLAALSTNSVVTLKTTGTVGAGTGLIRFQATLDLGSMAGTHTLNVLSAGGIEINAAIRGSTTGDAFNLNLSAVGNVTIASGVEVLLNSGTFTSSGVDFNGGKLISTGGGGVWLNHTGAVTLGSVTTQSAAPGATSLWVRGTSFTSTGSLKTQGGKIDIHASAGDVNIGGGPGVSVDAGSGDIAIRAQNSLTSAAPLTGNNISLTSGSDMSISGNVIGTGALDMRAGQNGFGTLEFTGAGPALTLQGSTINLMAGNSAVSGSFVRFSRSVNLTSLLGQTSINAGMGTIQVLGGTVLSQTSAGILTMTADEVDFSGAVNSVAGGRLRFATGSSGRNISIGSATAGTLNLSAAELANIGAGFTTLDFVKTGQSGNVSVDGVLTMARAMNILLGSGAFRLNSNLTLTGASSSFSNNGRTLIGPGNITLSAASAFFGGLVDASGAGANFHVTSPGLINFTNSIGASSALASLTVDGGGLTRVRNLVRAGAATFSNQTELLSNTTFNGGPVTFASSLDSGVGGPYSATFLGGPVSFLGGVGQTNALSSILTVDNATVAGNVRTIGSQTYGGTMTVNALSNFLAGGSWSVLGATSLNQSATVNASTVYFADAINSASARDLSVTSPGTITFASNVGLGGALRNLTVNGGGLTRITGTLNLTSAGQGQFFNATELLSDVLLTGGSFSFAQTLDSGGAGPFSLVATGPGTMSFAGNVGASNALRLIDTSGAFLTQVGGNVFTVLNQTYSQLRLTGSAGNRLFNSTSGDIFYNGAVAAISNDIGIRVNTPGIVTFNSTVGSGVLGAGVLAVIDRTGGGQTILRGNTDTTGLQSFDGNVLFDNTLRASAGGAFNVLGTSTLNGNVDIVASSVNLNGQVDSLGLARNLHVTSPGLIRFGSSIGAINSLNSLLVDGGGETRITTLIRAVDAAFLNAVNLTGNTVFSGGSVLFASTLDSLTANAFGAEFNGAGGVGNLNLLGPVGGSRALNFLISHVDATVASNITTANQQQFDQALVVTGPAIFTAGGAFGVGGRTTLADSTTINASSAFFGDLVDSAPGVPSGRLFVQSAGPITFTRSIGSLNQLVQLDVSGGGLTTINDTLNVQTADFRNNTLLGSNVTLQNGQYAFHQKLDSGSGGPYSLGTSAVSTLSLLGVVGGDSRLLSIDAMGAALTVLGANVTAQDFIRFGATRLDGNSVVTSFAGPIDFGTITSPTGRALGVATPGIVTFNGTVGTLAERLASITRTGNGLTILHGDTFTSGGQSFGGDVRFANALNVTSGGLFNIAGNTLLAGDVNIASNGANFAGNVDSDVGPARSLHVTSASPIRFGGAIGSTGALQSILVDGGGVTTLNALVRVLGSADFDNAVRLGSDLNLQGGTFRFGDTVDSGIGGPYSLASIGTGTVEFFGDVGNLSLLRSIDTSLATNTKLHGNLRVRDAIRLSELWLLDANAKSVASQTGTIDFLGAVAADSGAALNVFTPNTTEFHSTVGSGIGGLGALGSIARTGTGRTILNGDTLTNGGQSFAGALDLNGALTLNSGGIFSVGGVTRMLGDTVLNTAGFSFNGSVDSEGGPRNLLVTNSGTGFFADGLGGGGALSSLTINGTGISQFAGNVRLIPGGAMTVNQAAEIRGASDFRAGTITFNSTLDAAIGAIAPSLVLVADAVNFNANVGGTRALASLDASGTTLSRVAGNVTTTGNQAFGGLMLMGGPGTRIFTASNTNFSTIDAFATNIGMNVVAPGSIFFGGSVGFGGLGGTALASLTTGSGTTTLAGNTRTIGVTTFGGALITNGSRVVNASNLTVLGTTTLGNNFTFNGTNARFAGAVDAATSQVGSLLVNATNEARFENGVGQTRAIASFRSNANSTLLRGSMRTAAAGQAWFAGLLRIDSAPTGLTTIDTGNIFVGRDVYTDASASGRANLSLIARAAPTITVAPIRIGGNIGVSSTAPNANQRIGTLSIGTGGATPQTATIMMARTFDALGRIVAAGISPSDSFTIAADSYSMAAGQKLTVLGTLNLNVTGNATIADMTTLGDMNVNAGTITIVSRAAYSVLDNFGNPITDLGTDLVAGGAIRFNKAPILAPGAGKFTYSAISGPDPVLSNFSFRQYPTAITLANFRDDRVGSLLGPSFILSLDFASQGPTTSNVADTQVVQPPHLGEVEQVPQSVSVDPADQELLRQLGLSVQGASMEEIVSSFVGYSYYQNVPRKARPSVENRDYVVTADRLWMKAVVDLAKTYKVTMQRTVVDESGRASVQSRDAELRQMFADSWDRYTADDASRGDRDELAGYKNYLLANSEEKGTREEMAALWNVISKLQALGLTRLEAGIPEEKLLEMVRPPALSTDDMRQMIGAVVDAGVKAPVVAPPVEAKPVPTNPQEIAPVADRSRELLKVSKR